MSTHAGAQQIRRWQDDVARDPGSPAFLPLAEVYRREGRLDVARRLCLRGLARQPQHVEAHVLLGRIYREGGDLERACDELDIALRLDPQHRPARRALGYLSLERREWAAAVRHLEAAAAHDPADPRLRSALALARRQAAAGSPGEEHAPLLETALERFVRDARVRFALVLESSGRIVAEHGVARDLDRAALASLTAGIHSASREMARMLGQPGFEQLHQGQGERQLLVGSAPAAGADLLLVALFGSDAPLGLVRVRFDEFARAVTEYAGPAAGRSARPDAAAFEAELAAGLARPATPLRG